MHADLEGLLPAKAQLHISTWVTRCELLDRGDGKCDTARAKQLCDSWGATLPTVLRYFYAFRDHGRMGLIDRRKYARFLNDGAVRGLPPQFVQHWKSMNERFQRENGARHCYRILLDQLTQWRRTRDAKYTIPGYPTPPDNAPGVRHPLGWSYENLTRHLPEVGQRALARQGRQAFKKYLPKILTTRVGLEPGELINGDDDYGDVNVLFGQDVGRPLHLSLVDVATVYRGLHGMAGRYEADGKMTALQQIHFFWLLLTHFETEGFHTQRGTTVVQESGTAHINAELRANFLHASEGKIQIDTGTVDRRALRGLLFDGPAKGNPRFKMIEGTFSHFRTWTALLEGQTGRNRDEAPEEQTSLVRYAEKLLQLIPAEKHHLIMSPLMDVAQYTERYNLIKAALNNRTDHDMEGWEESGYMRAVFRLPEWVEQDKWAPLDQLNEVLSKMPRHEADEFITKMRLHPVPLFDRQRMSPREVWESTANKRTKLSVWKRHLVVPQHMARAVTVGDDRMIYIREDRQIKWAYIAMGEDVNGQKIILDRKQDLLLYVNPLNPGRALACNVHGKPLALLALYERPTRIDLDGFLKRKAERNEVAEVLEHEVSLRAGALTAERVLKAEHNLRLITNKPVTQAQKASGQAAQQAAAAAEDIYDADHALAPAPALATTPPVPGDDLDIFDQ